jgi:hypothetical protein
MGFGVTDDFEKAFVEGQDKTPDAGAEPGQPGGEETKGGEENKGEGAEAAMQTGEEQGNEPGAEPGAEPGELTAEAVLEFISKQTGKKVEKLEDLFATKEENPYAGIEFDERDKAYLKYKQETGRSYDDFLALNADLSKVSDLELAREKVRVETGKQLSDEQVDAYLERKLGIPDINDLDEADGLELATYTKALREQKLAEQQKFAVPAKGTTVEENKDMVTLADGSKMQKEVYDNLVKSRTEYLEANKAAVNSVAATVFNLEIDNNGTKEVISTEYVPDQNDKHSMLSMGEDLDATVARLFRSEKGFDHARFLKGVWRLDEKNWEKEVTAIVNATRAKTIEEMLKNENNINFNRNALDRTKSEEKRVDIFGGSTSGFGVKFDLTNP